MKPRVRDLVLFLAAALIIFGLALLGSRLQEDAVDGAWRELETVDYV